MSWILTLTGKRFELLAPTAAMIDPMDIAHSLAHQCRFNGHSKGFYSVAQHCCIVADLVPAEHQLAALLHDATEAYVGDLVRPLKREMQAFAAGQRYAYTKAAIAAGADAALLEREQNDSLLIHESGAVIDLTTNLFAQIEQRVWLAICERFDLEPELPACVHDADLIALATERRDLMPAHPDAWPCLAGTQPMTTAIKPWGTTEATVNYLNRLMQLLSTTHRQKVVA